MLCFQAQIVYFTLFYLTTRVTTISQYIQYILNVMMYSDNLFSISIELPIFYCLFLLFFIVLVSSSSGQDLDSWDLPLLAMLLLWQDSNFSESVSFKNDVILLVTFSGENFRTKQRTLTSNNTKEATYATLNWGGTTLKLSTWAGIQRAVPMRYVGKTLYFQSL